MSDALCLTPGFTLRGLMKTHILPLLLASPHFFLAILHFGLAFLHLGLACVAMSAHKIFKQALHKFRKAPAVHLG